MLARLTRHGVSVSDGVIDRMARSEAAGGGTGRAGRVARRRRLAMMIHVRITLSVVLLCACAAESPIEERAEPVAVTRLVLPTTKVRQIAYATMAARNDDSALD